MQTSMDQDPWMILFHMHFCITSEIKKVENDATMIVSNMRRHNKGRSSEDFLIAT